MKPSPPEAPSANRLQNTTDYQKISLKSLKNTSFKPKRSLQHLCQQTQTSFTTTKLTAASRFSATVEKRHFLHAKLLNNFAAASHRIITIKHHRHKLLPVPANQLKRAQPHACFQQQLANARLSTCGLLRSHCGARAVHLTFNLSQIHRRRRHNCALLSVTVNCVCI